MTLHRSHALAAIFSAVMLSTSSVAFAVENAPPTGSPSEESPAAQPAAPGAPDGAPTQHHQCRFGAAAKNLRAFFLTPDASGQTRLARVGVAAAVTTLAVTGTAAVAGAVTLATALPA